MSRFACTLVRAYIIVLLAMVATPLAACVVSVDHAGAEYSCELSPECPPGLACIAGKCIDTNASPQPDAAGNDAIDASPVGDAAVSTIALDVAVAGGSDDAEELVATGAVTLGSSDLEMTAETDGDQIVGIRFANLALEQGDVVTEAFVQFTTDEVSDLQTDLVIHAQAIDDAPTFTATINDISLRDKSAAVVAWSPAPWGLIDESGSAQQTPNLAPLIQEVIDHGQWTPGNSIVLIIEGKGARVARSFDLDPARAAILSVR